MSYSHARRRGLAGASVAIAALLVTVGLTGCTAGATPASPKTLATAPTGTATVTLAGDSYSFTVTSCLQSGKVLNVQGRPAGKDTATLSGIIGVAAKQPILFITVPDGTKQGAATQYIGASASKGDAGISFAMSEKTMTGKGDFTVRVITSKKKSSSTAKPKAAKQVSGSYRIRCGAIIKSATATPKPKSTPKPTSKSTPTKD
jgi:hypothetical protein